MLEGMDYRQYLRDQIKDIKTQYPNNEMLNGIKIKQRKSIDFNKKTLTDQSSPRTLKKNEKLPSIKAKIPRQSSPYIRQQ